MPSVLIEVRRTTTPEEETARMEAVHAALREAFKIANRARSDRRATDSSTRTGRTARAAW
jgi:hypothetical protein